MSKLFYLPLESYKERYTWFMSAKDGWAEDHFKANKIDFERIEGKQLSNEIKVGVVLDAYGRSYYAMSQIQNLILKLKNEEIKNGDVIYFEDFWHPGIESLFYIRDITKVDFKLATFLHAQSVDKTDFTYPMRHWIRDIEKGYSKAIDYIFVCSDILKDLCDVAGFQNIHKIGLPFNSKRLNEQLLDIGFKGVPKRKKPYVIFSSRFDAEKNPNFFLDLVEATPDIDFKLVKPRKIISNDKNVIKRLNKILKKKKNLEVVDTSEKIDYYQLLANAKVQFNCAYQDWVSWTLLECIQFEANPLYPNHKDFPTELKGFHRDHIYEAENLEDAQRKLRKLMRKPFDNELKTIVQRHDQSWHNYLKTMKLL